MGTPFLSKYDTEYVRAGYVDRTLFEFLVLEGAQAGLSWETILKKREHYREAFNHFDPAIVAKYDWKGEPNSSVLAMGTHAKAIQSEVFGGPFHEADLASQSTIAACRAGLQTDRGAWWPICGRVRRL